MAETAALVVNSPADSAVTEATKDSAVHTVAGAKAPLLAEVPAKLLHGDCMLPLAPLHATCVHAEKGLPLNFRLSWSKRRELTLSLRRMFWRACTKTATLPLVRRGSMVRLLRLPLSQLYAGGSKINPNTSKCLCLKNYFCDSCLNIRSLLFVYQIP